MPSRPPPPPTDLLGDPSATSLSVSAPRPETTSGRVVATVGMLVSIVVAAAGVYDVLGPLRAPSPTSSGASVKPADVAEARATLGNIAFVRPLFSTERDRALSIVEAELRAAGPSVVVNHLRGVVAAGANAFVESDA